MVGLHAYLKQLLFLYCFTFISKIIFLCFYNEILQILLNVFLYEVYIMSYVIHLIYLIRLCIIQFKKKTTMKYNYVKAYNQN